MGEFFTKLFFSDYMPHGHCYAWQPGVLWTHAISDTVIFLAYYSIPIALLVLVVRRPDLLYSWMFVLFALFILLCGTTHLLEVWTIWNGTYRLTGLVKALTALASLLTAIAVWPLIPRVLRIPSVRALEREIALRESAEDKLEEANSKLQEMFKEQGEDLSSTRSELDRRTDEIQQMVYFVSHDLNSPLVTIRGFGGRLRTAIEKRNYEKVEDYLGRIERAADRMGLLIDDALAYSAVGKDLTEPDFVELDKVVNEVFASVRDKFSDRRFELVRAGSFPMILGYTGAFLQVFENLISNAIQYGSDAESLCVTIGVKAENEETVLSVRDNGPGIPTPQQEFVFLPFHRGRRDIPGSGIGLAIVKKYVEKMQGRIWLESEEGQGSSFFMA